MKIVVDEMPKEPKECLFSHQTYHGNYVCNLLGGYISCTDIEECKCLIAKENEHD